MVSRKPPNPAASLVLCNHHISSTSLTRGQLVPVSKTTQVRASSPVTNFHDVNRPHFHKCEYVHHPFYLSTPRPSRLPHLLPPVKFGRTETISVWCRNQKTCHPCLLRKSLQNRNPCAHLRSHQALRQALHFSRTTSTSVSLCHLCIMQAMRNR